MKIRSKNKKWKVLSKSNLRIIYDIMLYIESNQETITNREIDRRFTKKNRVSFEKYCAGKKEEAYAETQGKYWALTQKGIRHTYDLDRLFEDQFTRERQWINQESLLTVFVIIGLGWIFIMVRDLELTGWMNFILAVSVLAFIIMFGFNIYHNTKLSRKYSK